MSSTLFKSHLPNNYSKLVTSGASPILRESMKIDSKGGSKHRWIRIKCPESKSILKENASRDLKVSVASSSLSIANPQEEKPKKELSEFDSRKNSFAQKYYIMTEEKNYSKIKLDPVKTFNQIRSNKNLTQQKNIDGDLQQTLNLMTKSKNTIIVKEK